MGTHPILNTTEEGIYNILVNNRLPKFELDVPYMRGQGFDNGSNMSEKRIPTSSTKCKYVYRKNQF